MNPLDRPRVEYRTPPDLVAEVRGGLVRIPPFQRGFKWESADVIALFDSVLHGFPIGNLLFWRRPAPAQRLRVGPLEVDAPQLDQAYWVVDGQQRVTSLVGALSAADTSADPRFRIHLDLATATFHSLGARQPAPREWVPVNRFNDTRLLLAWMRGNQDWLTEEQIALADSAAKAIREYQIPTYVVTTADENAVRRIFDRLNTNGKPLTKAEVFHALHSGLSETEPSDLRGIGSTTAELGFGRLDEQLALRCVLAYRGGDVYRGDFHGEFSSDEDRTETFRELTGLLREVVELLRDEVGMPHLRLMPYTHVVPVLVRFLRRHGSPGAGVARLIRRWIWRDALSGTAAQATSVAAIRQALAAVDVTESYSAAGRLLEMVPRRFQFEPDITRTHLNHAAAKINVLGLLAADPLDLQTGTPVAADRLAEEGGLVRDIVAGGDPGLRASFANRLVSGTGTSRTIRAALVNAPDEVLRSHMIDRVAHQCLIAGDDDGFLCRRAVLVTAAIRQHADAMAEWGARDGRRVAEMLRSAA